MYKTILNIFAGKLPLPLRDNVLDMLKNEAGIIDFVPFYTSTYI